MEKNFFIGIRIIIIEYFLEISSSPSEFLRRVMNIQNCRYTLKYINPAD